MASFIEFAAKFGPYILTGLLVTVEITLVSAIVAIVIGLLTAIMHRARFAPVRWLALAYVEIIRGTPALLQLFIVYFGLASYGLRFEPLPAAMLTLGIIGGAYVSEIFRAGIESVDRGQVEAATALGMRPSQTMRRIVLPQALVLMLPPLTNFLVSLIKDTSLALTISVPDIMYRAYDVASQSFRSMEAYAVAGCIYLAVCLPLSQTVRWLERRNARV